MNDTPEQDLDAALEASVGHGTVRYLKTLVTAMTVTTIVGLVVLVTVVVMRFSQTSPESLPPSVTLPDQITLPDGATAQAVTLGDGWYGVVTDKNEFVIFDASSGKIIQTTKIITQ